MEDIEVSIQANLEDEKSLQDGTAMPEPGKVIPVRVALRCRPLVAKELREGCQNCLTFVKGDPQVLVGHNRSFTYDYTFGPDSPQEAVYIDAVKDLVAGLFKGYNATVLAYGQTGSGKTHSMGTAYDAAFSDDEDLLGVIPRVVKDLFAGVKERDNAEFHIKVSFLEVYNEELKDLLSQSSKTEHLVVREDTCGSIKGLQEVAVNGLQETMQCLEQGSKGRTTGATAMNATSSRSHAIFTIIVEQRRKDDANDLIKCKFHLVDLAGSERAKRTQAEGERFKEGISINKGLLCLGNVISALGEDGQKARHIPYRDSKLTRLLQDSLGGNSHTVMIACVSPADIYMEETINTLRYADRARKIKNKPIINRDPQMAEIMRLRQIVQELQAQGVPHSGTSTGPSTTGRLSEGSSKVLQDRNQQLLEENGKLAEELRMAVDQTAAMCEKVVCAELARDELKEKLANLRCQASHHFESLNASLLTGDHTLAAQQLEQMKSIQEKITELETIEPAENLDPGTLETSQDSHSGDKDEAGVEESAKYALRQAKLGRELQELNKMLTKKEELASKMAVNEVGIDSMKKEYEVTMKQLEHDVSRLQTEKDDLLLKLHDAKTSNASNKVSEQRRKRLVELESDLGQLRRKITDQSKLLKVKDQTDQQCSKLGLEIKSMKQHRVRLMKQMKEDSEIFRKWRQQKDKEVLQLKAKDRKRQFELAKLERDYSKQQQVLRRKADEASSANRRLKEALQKQKTAVMERDRQLKVSDGSGIGQRVRNWLSRDFEVHVSLEEAKHHLTSLLSDRKQLTEQLAQLNDKLNEPPAKFQRLAWPETEDDTNDSHQKTKVQISDVQNDLRLCNAQISDFQQRIVDADHEDVKKMRWSGIRTMVEAKCALKWLMNTAVSAKVEATKHKSSLVDVRTCQDDVTSSVHKLEEEMKEIKHNHEEEKTEVQRQHQEKVLYLLKQLQTLRQDDKKDTTLDEVTKERLQFQEDEIDRLAKINEELEDRNEECSTLKKELTVLKYQAGTGGRITLMPSLCDAGSSPFVFTTPAPPVRTKSITKPPQPILEESDMSDDYSDDYSDDSESDYYPTPIKKTQRRKVEEVNENTFMKKTTSKGRMCSCKTGCSSKRCGCRTALAFCTDACGCVGCKNIEEITPDSTVGIDKETASILDNTESTLGESRVEMNTTFCIDDNNSPAAAKLSDKPVTKNVFADSSNQSDSPLEFKDPVMVTSLFPRKKKSTENKGPVSKRKRHLLSEGQRFFPGLSD